MNGARNLHEYDLQLIARFRKRVRGQVGDVANVAEGLQRVRQEQREYRAALILTLFKQKLKIIPISKFNYD